MTPLLLLVLAAAPFASSGPGMDTGGTRLGRRAAFSSSTPFAFFPNDTGTVFHWVARNYSAGAATSTPLVGPALTVTGTPTLGAGSCRYTQGLTLSDANNLSLASPNALQFTGDFSCSMSIVTSADTASIHLLVSAGGFGATGSGWGVDINDSAPGHAAFVAFGTPNTVKTVDMGAVQLSALNVLGWGRAGTTLWGQVNGGQIFTATGAPTTPSAFPLYIGRAQTTGFAFDGKILEMACTTSTPSGQTFSAPVQNLSSCPNIGAPLLALSSANVDGSNDATMHNGDLISSWRNTGTMGINANQATATSQPIYRAGPFADGKGSVHPNGVVDGLWLSGSDAFNWFQNAAVFEFAACYRTADPVKHILAVSSVDDTTRGFRFGVNANGKFEGSLYRGVAATVTADVVSTRSEQLGKWQFVDFRADNSKLYVSTDGLSFDGAMFSNPPPGGTGNAWTVGADTGTPSRPTQAAPNFGLFQGDMLFEYMYPRELSSSELSQLTYQCATRGPSTDSPTIATILGDSTAQLGTGSYGYGVHMELDHGPGLLVSNQGEASDFSSDCLGRWTNQIRGKAGSILIVNCSVNDAKGGTAVATTEANLQTIFDQARADGMTLLVMTSNPYKNFSSWTTTTQAATDALNAWIAAYAVAHPGVLLYDNYAALGGQGGDARVLLTIYDSGDGLHQNDAANVVISGALRALLGL